jgi:hypothetical protein
LQSAAFCPGRNFPDAGKVALWTKADSVTYFDTISIMPLK